MKYSYYLWLFTTITALLVVGIRSNPPGGECGKQHEYALCDDGYCCSNAGYCGQTDEYCAPENCQSQCRTPSPPPPPPPPFTPPPPVSPDDVSHIITSSLFEKMLKNRNDPRCKSKGFYTYDAFITAARKFPGFGTTGSLETRTRELAAFFGQTSHETTGGWSSADQGGPYAWGYCYIIEQDDQSPHCVDSLEWPCVPGEFYYGRGPIQISYNYNYGPAGKALGLDLLRYPKLVENDTVVSFETAIWFWMTPQYNKPSSHAVIVGEWKPTAIDVAANRLPGYGVITNIINGGVECGHGVDDRVIDRIGFYERYCLILGVSTGDNLDCYNQSPFNYGVLKMSADE
ncbi:endochitinase-like [Cannabis sativa]|nr:endochitinase-like [Cannabis sativa]